MVVGGEGATYADGLAVTLQCVHKEKRVFGQLEKESTIRQLH